MNRKDSYIFKSFIISIIVTCLFVVVIFLNLFSINEESIILGVIRIVNILLFITLMLGVTGAILFFLGLKEPKGYKYIVSVIVNIGSVIMIIIIIIAHFTNLKDVRRKSDIKGYWYSYNPQWGYYELTFYENEVGLFASFKGAKSPRKYYIEYPEIDIQNICWDSEVKRLNDSTMIIHYNVEFNRKDTLRRFHSSEAMFNFQDLSDKSKWWDALHNFNKRAYVNYYENFMDEYDYYKYYVSDTVQILDNELKILTRKDYRRELFAYIIKESVPKMDKNAQFPGGEQEMLKFIKQNTEYPKEALNNNISGKVYISFVIDKEGNITDPKVFRGVDSLLDSAALKVIKRMPKWEPAIKNGERISVEYMIPINFKPVE